MKDDLNSALTDVAIPMFLTALTIHYPCESLRTIQHLLILEFLLPLHPYLSRTSKSLGCFHLMKTSCMKWSPLCNPSILDQALVVSSLHLSIWFSFCSRHTKVPLKILSFFQIPYPPASQRKSYLPTLISFVDWVVHQVPKNQIFQIKREKFLQECSRFCMKPYLLYFTTVPYGL